MQITEVRVKTVVGEDDEKLKGFADVTLNGFFVIHGIRILKNGNGYFISMPAKKMPNGEYKDIVHPITSEFRSYMTNEIAQAFEKEQLKDCAISAETEISSETIYATR